MSNRLYQPICQLGENPNLNDCCDSTKYYCPLDPNKNIEKESLWQRIEPWIWAIFLGFILAIILVIIIALSLHIRKINTLEKNGTVE